MPATARSPSSAAPWGLSPLARSYFISSFATASRRLDITQNPFAEDSRFSTNERERSQEIARQANPLSARRA